MPRSAAVSRNGSSRDVKADFETHAQRIRKDISKLAESVTDAGTTLADNAKSGASEKVGELRRVSDDTVRELRDQLASVEEKLALQMRERPFTTLALAGVVGFLIALFARR